MPSSKHFQPYLHPHDGAVRGSTRRSDAEDLPPLRWPDHRLATEICLGASHLIIPQQELGLTRRSILPFPIRSPKYGYLTRSWCLDFPFPLHASIEALVAVTIFESKSRESGSLRRLGVVPGRRRLRFARSKNRNLGVSGPSVALFESGKQTGLELSGCLFKVYKGPDGLGAV